MNRCHRSCEASAALLALATLGACALTTEPRARATVIEPTCPEAQVSGTTLRVLHPYLAARICRLEHRSPRFHAEMTALRQGDLSIYVGTPEQVLNAERRAQSLGRRMPARRLADFSALHNADTGELEALIVRIDLPRIPPLLRRWARDNPRWRGTQAEVDEILDGILIHELWGHLIPVAQARSLHASCRDPLPRQPDLESCVMQRENELRHELGMRTRSRYQFSRWDR